MSTPISDSCTLNSRATRPQITAPAIAMPNADAKASTVLCWPAGRAASLRSAKNIKRITLLNQARQRLSAYGGAEPNRRILRRGTAAGRQADGRAAGQVGFQPQVAACRG